MNALSEESEALFVLVLEYATVKSFAILVRSVKFTKHQCFVNFQM